MTKPLYLEEVGTKDDRERVGDCEKRYGWLWLVMVS